MTVNVQMSESAVPATEAATVTWYPESLLFHE